MGCSDKDDDVSRFDGIYENLAHRTDINVLDPRKTAVPAKLINGQEMSASDVRDNI